jgi:hypothetical protein
MRSSVCGTIVHYEHPRSGAQIRITTALNRFPEGVRSQLLA